MDKFLTAPDVHSCFPLYYVASPASRLHHIAFRWEPLSSLIMSRLRRLSARKIDVPIRLGGHGFELLSTAMYERYAVGVIASAEFRVVGAVNP